MKETKLAMAFCFSIFSFVNASAQEKTFTMKDANQKCIYNIANGKMTGNFTSYYENGKLKSEGTLVNGYRNGLWTVWDSSGRKRMERNYKNIFEFERIIPTMPKDGPIPLLSENGYKMEYNKDNIIEYAKFKSENSIWRHKFWRTIELKNNEYLFKENMLFNLIKSLASTDKIELYNVNDDRFTEVVKKETYNYFFQNIDSPIISFEIKEESIFDLDKMRMETRIIGLCPLKKVGNELKPLFWVYYPDLRKYFGKQIIPSDKIKDNRIKSLDDLFIFRNFASTIIKTTIDNPYDFFIKKYKEAEGDEKKIAVLAEEAALRIIEDEHNIWLSLTK